MCFCFITTRSKNKQTKQFRYETTSNGDLVITRVVVL